MSPYVSLFIPCVSHVLHDTATSLHLVHTWVHTSAGDPYIEVPEASTYNDAGAYGYDFVNGYDDTLKAQIQLCSRPADIEGRMWGAEEWGVLDISDIKCAKAVRTSL